MASDWFEAERNYASLNKPGEVVAVKATWGMGPTRYAGGMWIKGPRYGESWSRCNYSEEWAGIFNQYEETV